MSSKTSQKRKQDTYLSFDNSLIFGKEFTRSSKLNGCGLFDLLQSGILNFDGKVTNVKEDAKTSDIKKKLWLYIRYLWFHNYATNSTFAKMSKDMDVNRSTPCARNFIYQVLVFKKKRVPKPDTLNIKDALQITSKDLADFINQVLDSDSKINIPILLHMLKLVMQKIGNIDLASLKKEVKMQVPVTIINSSSNSSNSGNSSTNEKETVFPAIYNDDRKETIINTSKTI